MKLWLHRLTELTHLCLESACPLCQRSTTAAFCPTCQQQLQRSALRHPAQFWQPPLPILAWGHYGGSLKRMIAALKYEGHPRLAEPLGQALAQLWLTSAISARAPKPLVVVPIPMHSEKQQQRGFNQAELIASTFCRQTGLPQVKGLNRRRNTAPQFGLSAIDRAANLANAFELGEFFSGRKLLKSRPTVLLLDDIYTTGATALAAAQTLRRHQISVYGILTVAKTGSSEDGQQDR